LSGLKRSGRFEAVTYQRSLEEMEGHFMRKTVSLCVATVCAGLLTVPAMAAATWNYAGTSASPAVSTALLQDYKRVKYYDVVRTPDGRIYMTSGTSGRGDAGDSNGLTIFTPNDVNDLTAGWTQVDVTTTGRGITKMVVAGDGHVYGVRNWYEVAWNFPGSLVNADIIRIHHDGAIDVIQAYEVEPAGDIWANWESRPNGLAVGGDGNVYWTIGANSNYWKFHYLWKYDVTADTVTESPNNAVIPPDPGVGFGGFDGNNGMKEIARVDGLEYVEAGWFAIMAIGAGNVRADAMSWTHYRDISAPNGNIKPDWGIGSVVNRFAYDSGWNKLWYGPLGNTSSSRHSAIMGRWNGNTMSGGTAPANIGLFETADAPNYAGQPGISKGVGGCFSPNWDGWHANGNDPAAKDTSGQFVNPDNGGAYWVSSLAVNPRDGKAWVSWGSQSSYNNLTVNPACFNGAYAPVGKVYTIGRNDCGASGDEGSPQAGVNSPNPSPAPAIAGSHGSQVVALTFAADKVFAVTVDMSDPAAAPNTGGKFNLFWADNPSPPPALGACCTAQGCAQVYQYQCAGEWTESAPCAAPGVTGGVDCTFRACHTPFADADGDHDVDQTDFAVLQACLTYVTVEGGGQALSDSPVKCNCFDTNGVDLIDNVDLGKFLNCVSGPGIAADPNCGN
jgi:hypothetical protein